MTTDALLSLLLTAKQQAGLAKALYGGREAVKEYAESQAARYRYFEIANHRAAALIFRDHYHFSVCGSNDRQDWLQNATTGKGSVGRLVAHRGFIEAAEWIRREVVRSDLMEIVLQHDLPGVIGGHSLGGAVAQILALEERFGATQVVTLGSPKVWERSSAASYYAYGFELHRFVTEGDIVPYMPFAIGAWLTGRPAYVHASAAMRLAEDGSVAIDELGIFRRAIKAATQTTQLAVAVGLMLVNRRLPDAHGIDRYCESIKASIERVSNA